MSEDFFQYAESQMGGSADATVTTPYTCWAASGVCASLPQAMNEATEMIHSVVSKNALAHSREASARGDTIETRWLTTSHQVTRIEGTEKTPATYIVTMVATLEMRHCGPDESSQSELG